MSLSSSFIRIRNRCRLSLSVLGGRRMVQLRPSVPIISFTFDDFPRSAILEAGAILQRHGVQGTYYVSLGMMDQQIPAGLGFSADDLRSAAEGHELGCHTFGHCHAWDTDPAVFEASIIRNRSALEQLVPGASLKTLSYPISCPRPQTKRLAAKHFLCCRGGGHAFNLGLFASKPRPPAFNLGPTDANSLQTHFLEKTRDHPTAVRRMIDENCRAPGWLIFATHDVCPSPSPFGVSPQVFEEVVRYAVRSGARVLPVAQAWEAIRGIPSRSAAAVLEQ